MRSRNSSSFQTEPRTGLTKSIFRAPNRSCSTDVAHCMNFHAASFFFEKLDIARDQIQTFGVGAFAAGLEIAENIGIEDHGRRAGAEISPDLIPRIGRPVLRARLLDHLHPLLV